MKSLPKIKENLEVSQVSHSCNQRSVKTHTNTPLLKLAKNLYCFVCMRCLLEIHSLNSQSTDVCQTVGTSETHFVVFCCLPLEQCGCVSSLALFFHCSDHVNVQETTDMEKKEEKMEESTVSLKVRVLLCSLSASNLWKLSQRNKKC